MSKDNILTVTFGKEAEKYTKTVYQWDKGKILYFTDVSDGTEVQFANGNGTINKITENNQVQIPDELLANADTVIAFVRIIGDNSETTVKVVKIPIQARPKPSDYVSPDDEPTFRQEIQKIMDKAVNTAQSVEQRADNGEFNGKDYILTEDDKSEIAENIKNTIEVQEEISSNADVIKNTNARHIHENISVLNMIEELPYTRDEVDSEINNIVTNGVITYVESTGVQYINTGIIPDENTTVIVDFEPVEIGTDAVFGCDNGNVFDSCFGLNFSSTGTWGLYNGQNIYTSNESVPQKERYKATIEFGKAPIIEKTDGTVLSFITGTSITFNNAKSLYLFAKNRNSSINGLANIKLFGFTIKKNDVTVLNLVPSMNNDKACLYDTVSQSYLYDENGNDFSSDRTGRELKEDIIVPTHWKGKKWYAYGTSLTDTSTLGKYPKYVEKLSGMIRTNKGIGGGGLVANTKVKDAVMNVTDGKTEADLITLECLANDGGATMGTIDDTDGTTFCGALAQCIKYLQQNTIAQIVVILSPQTRRSTTGTEFTPQYKNSAGLSYRDKAELMEGVCELYNVPFINTNNAGLGYYRKTDDYYVDHAHHTELGGQVYGEYIWSQLKDVPLWH